MPKVTVMSLPEESIQMLDLPKTRKNIKPTFRVAWRNLAVRIKLFAGDFDTRNVLVTSLLAFLLGRVVIMSEMSPFGLAFFAAAAPYLQKKAYFCGAAAILGLVSSGQYIECAIYFFSVFAYFKTAEKLSKTHNKLLAVPLLMFCAVLASGFVMMFAAWEVATLYTALLVIFNAAICMISAFLFSYSMPLLVTEKKSNAQSFANENFICMLLLLAIALSGLSGLRLFSASVGGIAGSLLILSVAFCGNMGSGGTAGTLVGLTIGLTSGQAFAIGLYALSGVLAGCFRTLNKYSALLGYLFGNIIIVLYFGRVETAGQYICEAALAGLVFLFIPRRYLTLWQERLKENGDSFSDEQVQGAVQKLENIAVMFSGLGGAGGSVSDEAKIRLREEEVARALSSIGEKVCQECTNRSKCWEDEFYSTSQAMMDMLEIAEKGKLTSRTLPRYFNETCIKKSELMGTVHLVVEYNQTQGYWRKKMLTERQLVSEQMKATAQIIKNLAREINKEPLVNKPTSAKLKEKAALLDCQLDKVMITGKGAATIVEITKQPCSGRRECVNTVLPLAAGLLREKMMIKSRCGTVGNHKPCKLTMHAAKNFSIATAVASSAKVEGAVNGDNCAVLPLSGGKVALLLSDGMGSGSEAAAQSNSAIRFLKEMLELGFAVDVAVETVNAMLLLKSPEEKFATLDMLIIDLYSAEGEFLKIGAAPSYVKRVREVGVLKGNSLPIGILNNIEIDPIKVKLAAGDIIVMVSDGIADALPASVDKELWLSNILRRMPEDTPKTVAGRILDEAKRSLGGKDRDDMTVLCIKLDQKVN